MIHYRKIFGEDPFGGVQAREHWSYLLWEVDWLEEDGGTAILEEELDCGRDPFAPGFCQLDSVRRTWYGSGDLEDYGMSLGSWNRHTTSMVTF